MKSKVILQTGIIFVLIMSVQSVFAVPAVPWPVEKVQPDGTKITVYLKGDEKVHWMESEDGYTLMYDSKKTVVYAEQNADGNMMPSKVIFKGNSQLNPPPKNIRKGLYYSRSQIQALKKIWEIEDNSGIRKAPAQQAAAAPVTGNKKALCILAGFSDKAFTKSVGDFEALMNQTGYSANGAQGSVQDFYKENSYGQMILTVTVVGTYSLPKTTTYYATHEQEFAAAVVQMADADVDFTEFANASNQLETFHIIYAGYGDEAIQNGQQIWAHKWQLASPLYLDGVRVSVYSCSPELRSNSGSTITAIGVICHELGHVFGSPDYYDSDYDGSGGNYPGTGKWDLMAGGSWNGNGVTPAHINMFQKIQYGWVTPTALTNTQKITNMLNSAQNPVAYTIEANNDGEMYLLENRQKTGFDVSVPGHGLLIYHIHKEMDASAYNPPNTSHPQKLYVVCASSSTAIPNTSPSSYGSVNSGGAPFPGTSNKTTFTDKTTPQAFSWTTQQGIDKPLTNISESNKLISFMFNADVWKGATTAWNTASNWATSSIPNSKTIVYIPKNVPNFPFLTGNKTNNICKEIYFEAGAEIGRQDLLTYGKAHIQFDFSSQESTRNRWHLLSVPLEKVYSGDFGFGGYPYTFLRKFTTVTDDKAGWEPILKDNEPFAIGEGFALWINANDGLTKGNKDAGEGTDPLIHPEKRQYGLQHVNGIINLPYFEDEKQSRAHRVHKYESGNSIFYPIFAEVDDLPLRNRPVSVTRSDDAYQMLNTAQIEIPLTFGEDHGRYFALIGNPFMTTIDFDKLYNNNATKIKPLFRIWNGTEFVEYTIGNGSGKYITPMQAFFVEKADSYIANEKLILNINTISK